MAPFDLLVRNTSEVLTLSGDSKAAAEVTLAPLEKGAVGIVGEQIAFLGAESALPSGAIGPATRVIDALGGFVGPGFVDAHTHLVFAGERSAEFDLRNRGASYQELAAAGGGIMSTVRATRAATEDELVELALPRLRRLLEQGVTCAEVKSGYGLDLETELKMLRAIRRLDALQPVELIPTLLCLHAVPAEWKHDRAGYLALCRDQLLPAVAREKLARFVDVFVEEGAFTADEARAFVATARAHGLVPRLHVDQLSTGQGAELAAELGAASADHLERVSDAGIAALARGEVCALLVPVSTLFLHVRPYAPGRKLIEGGVTVALGTNVNPGSAMSESVALTLGLACLENGLSPAEAYRAMTLGGAVALRRDGKSAESTAPRLGRLAVGGAADFVVFDCRSYRHLPYHLGVSHARVVCRRGRVVAERAASTLCG